MLRLKAETRRKNYSLETFKFKCKNFPIDSHINATLDEVRENSYATILQYLYCSLYFLILIIHP